ncbi:MAG: SMC family ATPase [Dictyoglomaceae bacterium]|nr:SMC family ATPase [Dictyoglomaceae bacterium]
MIRLKSLEIFNFKRYEYEKLDFPLQGRFLIKGKNEAGKSSIFEAIIFALFGRPVYINGKENLINFSQDKAKVILSLDLDNKEIYIERTLKRNSSQECLLKIHDKKNPERIPIVIRKVNDVNDRIEKELGLDYITLLNTCFVEQKNIGRLENSDKSTRQKIIISLFNLEFLTDLSKRVKEEKEVLEEKLLFEEITREACLAKKKYPLLNEEISKIKQEKIEIEAIERAKKIKEEKENISNLEKEIEKFSKTVEEYKEKVEFLRKNLEELNKLEKIFDLNKRILEKQANKENIENKIEENTNRIKEIPKLLKEIENLKHNINIKKRIEKLKRIREELNKIDSNIKELLERRKEIEELLKSLEDISEREKEIKKAEILVEELKEIERALQIKKLEEEKENTQKVLEKFENLIKYEEQIDEINGVLKNYTIKTILSFLSLIISIFLLFSNIGFLFISLASLVILVIFLLRRNRIREQRIKLSIRKEDIEKEIKEFKMDEIRKRFEEINKEIEEIIVDDKLREMDLRELISSKAIKEKEIENLRELKRSILNEKEELSKSLLNLGFENIHESSILKENLEKIEEKISELELFKNKKINQWEKIFIKVLNLDKYPEKSLENLNREESKLEERIENLKNLYLEIEKNKEEIINIEKEVNKIKEEVKILSEDLMENPTQENKEKLEKNIKILREEKVEDKFEYYKKILEQRNGEKKARLENLERIIREFQNNFPEKNWEEISEKEIDYKLKEILEKRELEISEELSRLKFIMERYEKNTGKKIEDLDPDKEEETLNKIEREKIKMHYAQQILEGTTKKILDTVSPRTLAYMQKILPILTMDRYHVVHLDSETFKLKVYDNSTNKYYDKDILSGGTQDQFSLALRLAFAIANLPQDKGTNPGFIFLDEPLGSFDEERAHALIELLTHGEIAEHFDQIFVITHVILREEYFDYCIHIENGKIIYKDL